MKIILASGISNQLRSIKRITFLLLFFMFFSKNGTAQSLGLNTSGALPDSSAMLDIISANKGLLIPRINLASTTDTTTISHPAASLLVYNTNAVITGGSGLGYYYFNDSMWVNFLTGTGNSLTIPLLVGGSGTTSSLTYKPTSGVGTTGADHVFQVGNNGATEALRILNNSKVGIGITAPLLKTHIRGTAAYPSSSGQIANGVFVLDGSQDEVMTMGIGNASPYGGWIQTQNLTNSNTTRPLSLNPNGGNVGIGTTAPTTLIDVEKTSGSGRQIVGTFVAGSNATGNGSTIGLGSTQTYTGFISGLQTASNEGDLTFGTQSAGNYSEKMRVVGSTGNVGIGLTAPLGILGIRDGSLGGTANGTTPTKGILIDGSGTTGSLNIGIDATGGTFYAWLQSRDRTTAAYYGLLLNPYGGNVGIGTNAPAVSLEVSAPSTSIQLRIRRTSANAAFADIGVDNIKGISFWPDGYGTSSTNPKVVFDPSGNVGIGTTIPLSKLELSGSLCTSTPQDLLTLSRAYNNGISYARTASLALSNDLSDNTQLDFKLLTTNGVSTIAPNITVMTLKSNGNVGIGVTSPSAKLHTISTTEQLRLGYDASNYYSSTVNSTGAITFDAVGSGSAFTFSDAVNLPTGSIGVTQSANDSTTKLATTAFVDRAVAGAAGGSSGWGLTGTSGTSDGTNFIGTTDNVPFSIKVNNQKAGRIDSTKANAFWGFKAGNDISSGTNLSGIGYKALSKNTSGSYNTAIGAEAIYTNTTGSYNTASGYKSLYSNTTGESNTVNGYQALYSNTAAGRNTAIGYKALYTQSYTNGSPWNSDNIAIGYEALYSNEPTAAAYYSGNLNTAVGNYALKTNTTGFNNTALGAYSLNHNTTGYSNTANGYEALRDNTTGSINTAMGYQALASNTEGQPNQAFGSQSLSSNTTGIDNNAFGYSALSSNTTGNNNVAVGNYSAAYNTSGSNNVALGHTALHENLVGSTNVAVGLQALLYNTASNNIGIGYNALVYNTSGTQNTAIGLGAGSSNTTTSNNTYVGYNADASSSLNNITAIGANTSVSASNKVRIGDANVTVIEGQVSFTSVSDGRFKKNISESDVKGLPFIMKLRPVAYNLDTRQFEEFLVKNKPDSIKIKHFKNRDFTASTAIRHSGFIAQEVEVAAQETNYDFNGLHKPENVDDNYGLAYSEFVVPLVKAVQEQQQQLKDKDVLLTSLQNQIDQLTILIQQIQNPKKSN